MLTKSFAATDVSWPGVSASAEIFDATFFCAILDHVAHPVFVKDRKFRFVYVNMALCALVGHPREAMLGKTDYDFFSLEEADFFRLKDRQMFETMQEVTINEESITDATGRCRVLATTKVPLGESPGEVTHLVGIIHDITQLKETEDALRQANEQLEQRVAERTRELASAQHELLRKQRLAVLGQLVGSLAHQIRNPLSTMLNAASVLQRVLGENAHPDAKAAVAMIHEEVRNANRIVFDLLDYARVRPSNPRPSPLFELIEMALRSENVPPSVVVRTLIPADLKLLADVEQIDGAIRNLIRNAIEAMPNGGALTLAAHRAEGQGVLTIQDSGDGISPDVLAHLFEPLVTTKPLGIGLGLTTARALLENQSGTLCNATPTDHQGACFEIRLPLAPSSP